MWNLIGFMIVLGVLLTMRWALRVWDRPEPRSAPVPAVTPARGTRPAETAMKRVKPAA